MHNLYNEKTTQHSPIVAVSCITYNHKPYIRDCLEGFTLQKTNFQFVVIVHDDASTDGTSTIIKEYAEKYPKIIKPIYETENQYSKKDGSLDRIMFQAIAETGCKYVAICEGDDYWVDPYKLQKQVDFLEQNPDYVLYHSDCKILNHTTGEILEHANINTSNLISNNIFKDIIMSKYVIRTASVMVRKYNMFNSITSDDFVFKSGYFKMGDTPLWLELLQEGKFYYSQDPMVVYRYRSGSACRPKSLKLFYGFQVSMYELRLYYLQKYKISDIELQDYVKSKYIQNLFYLRCIDRNYKTNSVIDTSFYVEKKTTLLKSNAIRICLYIKQICRGYFDSIMLRFSKR